MAFPPNSPAAEAFLKKRLKVKHLEVTEWDPES
jgi:hypothetical protein